MVFCFHLKVLPLMIISKNGFQLKGESAQAPAKIMKSFIGKESVHILDVKESPNFLLQT